MEEKKDSDALEAVLLNELNKTKLNEKCLSSEEIAAFIEKKLENNEKKRVMEHLSYCSDCTDVYLVSLRLKKKEKKSNIIRFNRMALAASVLFMIIALGIIYKIGFEPGNSSRFYAQINAGGELNNFLLKTSRKRISDSRTMNHILGLLKKQGHNVENYKINSIQIKKSPQHSRSFFNQTIKKIEIIVENGILKINLLNK